MSTHPTQDDARTAMDALIDTIGLDGIEDVLDPAVGYLQDRLAHYGETPLWGRNTAIVASAMALAIRAYATRTATLDNTDAWDVSRMEHETDVLRDRIRALEKERDAARAAVSSAGDAVAFSPRDWGVDHRDAWIYGILLGWSCEEDHEHDYVCGGDTALTEVAERHRWDVATVAKLREHRAALASHGQTHSHYEDQPRPCRAPAYGPDWEEAAHCDRPTGHTGWHSTEDSVVEWADSTTTAPTHGGHDE